MATSVFAVDDDGDRALIGEGDVHVGAELAGGDFDAELAGFFDKLVDHFCRGGGFHGADETGAASFSGVAVECELGDDEESSLNVEEGEVHLVVLVGEDAQVDGFFEDVLQIGGGIALPYSEQDEESCSDLADGLVVDHDRGMGDALKDGAHDNLPAFFGFDGPGETDVVDRQPALGTGDGCFDPPFEFDGVWVTVPAFGGKVVGAWASGFEVVAGDAEPAVAVAGGFEEIDGLAVGDVDDVVGAAFAGESVPSGGDHVEVAVGEKGSGFGDEDLGSSDVDFHAGFEVGFSGDGVAVAGGSKEIEVPGGAFVFEGESAVEVVVRGTFEGSGACGLVDLCGVGLGSVGLCAVGLGVVWGWGLGGVGGVQVDGSGGFDGIGGGLIFASPEGHQEGGRQGSRERGDMVHRSSSRTMTRTRAATIAASHQCLLTRPDSSAGASCLRLASSLTGG